MVNFITDKQKKEFCSKLFHNIHTPLGFIDVGSGGELKAPWTLLPSAHIRKFDFDPEEIQSEKHLPVCVSNKDGLGTFYIAHNPRGSSLHPPFTSFVERFAQNDMLTQKEIQVELTTLDSLFKQNFKEIDVLDINVEGHDFFVLEGATQLFKEAFVKCIKIEFELTEVWVGQGWFGDIDGYLRNQGYDLVNIEIEYGRPVNARTIYHQGEPLWGKAIYIPNEMLWQERYSNSGKNEIQDIILKAVGLYVVLNLPGRAMDVLKMAVQNGYMNDVTEKNYIADIHSIFRFAKLDALLNFFLRKLRLIK
jgi:FkbM family methyltransferase